MLALPFPANNQASLPNAQARVAPYHTLTYSGSILGALFQIFTQTTQLNQARLSCLDYMHLVVLIQILQARPSLLKILPLQYWLRLISGEIPIPDLEKWNVCKGTESKDGLYSN